MLKNKKIYLYALAIIGLAVHFRWFNLFGIFTSGDWTYLSHINYKDLTKFRPLWINHNFVTPQSKCLVNSVKTLSGIIC